MAKRAGLYAAPTVEDFAHFHIRARLRDFGIQLPVTPIRPEHGVASGSHLQGTRADDVTMEIEPTGGARDDAGLANLGIAGLVFGQVISERPFSWLLTGLAIGMWVTCVSVAIWLAGANDS